MNLWFGCLFCIVFCASLRRSLAGQDVDGTIVWVDNDKKEKEITIGKQNAIEGEDLKYWNIGDRRIKDVGDIVDSSEAKNKVKPPKYVGTENTPSVYDKRKPKVSPNNVDTVDAEVVNDEESNGDAVFGGDSRSVEFQQDESHGLESNSHRESHDTQENSEDTAHDSNSAGISSEAELLVNGHGQGLRSDYEVASESRSEDGPIEQEEESEPGEVKSHVHKAARKKTKSSSKRITKVNVKGDKRTLDKSNDEKISDDKDFKKAKSMLYAGVNVKKDDIASLEPQQDEVAALREKMGIYAPDDKDVSEMLARFTDKKGESGHRMGNDELQMHLDDEALKMEVKAIEEEDSNVKSVLQGSEKFASDQKLNRLEGGFEKDIIKNIGKAGLELDGPGERRDGNDRDKDDEDKREDGGKDFEEEKEEKDEEDDRERKFKDEEEDERREDDENGREDDSEKENSEEHRNMDDRDSSEKDWKNENRDNDEAGDRKDLVWTKEGNVSKGNSRKRAKKYNFYSPTGKLGGDISPTEEAEMGVNIDNQAMETEIKQIENEDAKVSSVLENAGKGPKLVDLEEYKFDTLDSAPGKKLEQHRYSVEMSSAEQADDVDNADQKHEIGQDKSNAHQPKLGDEIRAMLQETSKVLNETNAVLNEGRMVTEKSKEVLGATIQKNISSNSEANKVSGKDNATAQNNASTKVEANNIPDIVNNSTINNTVRNSTDSEDKGNSSVNYGNKTTDKSNNTTQNVTSSQNNSQGTMDHRVTLSTDKATEVETETAKSADEFIENGKQVSPSKRELKKNEADRKFKKSYRKGKKKSNHFKRKPEHVVIRPNQAKHQKQLKKLKNNKKRYTDSELKILNLMYKSPIFASVRGHIASLRSSPAEKRSYTPGVKTTYRRFKKPKNSVKRGQFTRKRLAVIGKKRAGVEEGMTGAISYTNRDGNEFMFAVSKQLLTWVEANSKCRSLGGELLSIGDKEEQEFIQTNVIPEKSHYWIGFTDQENEGTWQWTDRTPVRYSNWSNLEPDDGNIKSGQATHNEDCAVINPTMDWSDVPCWNRFQFICKFLPDNGRAISFGGTLSHSDVGNKQDDEFAQSLKGAKKPKLQATKPVVEGTAKTREKGDKVIKPSANARLQSAQLPRGSENGKLVEGSASTREKNGKLMMKGYSGTGPSRGGDKAEETTMDKGKNTGTGEQRDNAAMTQGKEAGVKGGAEAAANGGAGASGKGVSIMEAGKNGLKQVANALNQAAKNVGQASKPIMDAGNAASKGSRFGLGPTGLGSIPGITGAGINGNPGLGKVGGVDGAGAAPGSVQKGGNGGQSPINLTPGGQGGGSGGTGGGAGGGASGGAGGGAGAGAGGAGGGGAPGGGGANGGAPGHVATNGGLAQAPGGGGAAGGGAGAGGGAPAGTGGGASGGGATGGGAPGGGAPGGGAPGGGAPGGGAPSGGGGPANGGGGGGAPQINGGAPAPVQQAPTVPMQATPTTAQGGGGGGGPQLTPEQAAAAKQLANQIAPQLAKEYASKFEPDMEMIQTICGKFCADTAISMPGDDPSKLGKACGRICAESLMKMSPEEVMGVLAGMKNAKASPTPSVVPVVPAALPGKGGGEFPASGGAPVGATGGNMNKGENVPGNVGGNEGAGNSGGGSSGGNSGGGNGGGGNGGGGNGGGGNMGGSSNANANGGGGGGNGGGGNKGGLQINLGNGDGVNLQTLGSILAPNLGLNIEGNGKISVAGGQTLNDKVSEAIDSLKEQHKLKTNTASKSSTPQRRTENKKEDVDEAQNIGPIKGYLLLKNMQNNVENDIQRKLAKKRVLMQIERPAKDEGPLSLGYVTGTKRELKGRKKAVRKSKKRRRKRRKHKRH